MSAHNAKSRAQVQTKIKRQSFAVAHVEFELVDHPDDGVTFGLRPVFGPADRRCLFSGHIERGMGTQLRRLAHAIDVLEAKLK